MNNASIRRFGIALVAASALFLSACSSSSEVAESASPTAPAVSECSPETLQTLTTGKLAIATGEPAYYPWVIDDAPESGAGFEAAVAMHAGGWRAVKALLALWMMTAASFFGVRRSGGGLQCRVDYEY